MKFMGPTFAYLVHDGKKLLLATKKLDAASAPAEPVLRQYELPEELPSELEFIEYEHPEAKTIVKKR